MYIFGLSSRIPVGDRKLSHRLVSKNLEEIAVWVKNIISTDDSAIAQKTQLQRYMKRCPSRENNLLDWGCWMFAHLVPLHL